MTEQLKFPRQEIDAARAMFTDQIAQIEVEGRNVSAFASAALLAACELYAECHGGEGLRAAFEEIIRAQQVHSGVAGRA